MWCNGTSIWEWCIIFMPFNPWKEQPFCPFTISLEIHCVNKDERKAPKFSTFNKLELQDDQLTNSIEIMVRNWHNIVQDNIHSDDSFQKQSTDKLINDKHLDFQSETYLLLGYHFMKEDKCIGVQVYVEVKNSIVKYTVMLENIITCSRSKLREGICASINNMWKQFFQLKIKRSSSKTLLKLPFRTQVMNPMKLRW